MIFINTIRIEMPGRRWSLFQVRPGFAIGDTWDGKAYYGFWPR